MAKLIVAFLPSWLLAVLFTFVFSVLPGLATYPLILALPLETLLVGGLISLVLLMDIYSPDFRMKLELGRHTQSGSGKLVVTILALMLFAFVMMLTLAFPGFYNRISLIAGWDRTWVMVGAIAVAFIEGVAMITIAFILGRRRLARLLRQE